MKPPVTNTRSRAGFALAILFAINLLNFYDRFMFGALAEPIRKEWALSDAQIGWLSTAFTLLYAAVGLPLGRLADRSKRPRMLGIGVALWSVLTAASGVAWSYGSLFAARLGVGIGEASCAPASSSLIGDLYPPRKRSWAVSIFMLGLPLGTFFGTLISGRLAADYGWRVACYFACVPGLILALMAARIYDPPRGSSEASPSAGREYEGSAFWSVLRIPTLWWIIVSGALFNFYMYAIGIFLPAFLSRYHGLDLKQSNAIAALVFGGAGVPGLLIGGWIADVASRRRPNGRMLLASLATLAATPCAYFALGRPAGSVLSFSVLMGTSCLLSYLYYSGVYAAVQDVVPPVLRGTAMAIYFFAMYLLGGSFGPVATGWVSDHFARAAMISAGANSMTEAFRAAGLHSAMYLIPACSLILFGVLAVAACTITGDLKNVQRWMAREEMKADLAVPSRT